MLVDGNWSPWQPWGECSASCGIGERTRVRFCNSPAPTNKGRPCPGDSTQLSRCNIQPCPGKKKKEKNLKKKKKPTCCISILQIEELTVFEVCVYMRTWLWHYVTCYFAYSGGPQKARGSIIGTINGVEFGIAFLNATIFNSPSGGRVIHATITNIPRSLGQSQAFSGY